MKKRLVICVLVVTMLVCLNACVGGKVVEIGNEEKRMESRNIYEPYDRYVRPIREYVGLSPSEAGYTSPSGYKYDIYGDIKLPIRIEGPDGEIFAENVEDLCGFIVVEQFPKAKTGIKVSYNTDDEGNEFEHYPKEISVEEIILYIEKEK